MLFSIDLETECTVHGCVDHGKSICRNGHSLNPWQSRITVIGVASDDGVRRVFRGEDKVSELKLFLEMHEDYVVCGHNFKFDALHLAKHGFTVPMERWVADSQLAAYILTDKIPDHWLMEYERNKPAGVRAAGKHSLKTLAPFFLGVEPYWEAKANGHHDNDEYVLKDTEYTLQLVKVLESHLRERGEFEFYSERMLPWTKMLLEAELRGIAIDFDELLKMEEQLQVRSKELKAKLDEQWAPAHRAYYLDQVRSINTKYDAMKPIRGREERRKSALNKAERFVDYDSPKQMSWLLKDYLGYSIESFAGKEGTGRAILERLANEGKEDVKTYLEWRRANKLLSAFIPKYKELAVKEGAGHVIHPVFNPTNTRTGRTSSERPNMQQVPPSLRHLFTARPGYKFIGYDAAAIEAKLIALYSEDKTLFNIIQSGVSIHDHNTKVFFGLGDEVPYSSVKSDYAHQRAASKNVGFALFYNAGATRIRIAFAEKGYMLSPEECKRLHERFKRSYPGATTYSKAVVDYMEKGNVLPNLLGRPLKIEHAEDAYMQAFNTLIQSSASDLLLHGAYVAQQELNNVGIDAKAVNFVHDFCSFEVKEEHVDEADRIIKNALTNFTLTNQHGQIHLEVDGGVSERWTK